MPELGLIKFAINFRIVLFPAPDGPIKVKKSPFFIPKDRLFKIVHFPT
ncbi:hypothetical protein HMPREF0514_10604 [Lactobacillus paragasseri JV-V03]|uniref:Uncharacterized protein n=1 Tax=Lactobacillus paragasseri JV-V03 TaxID=525326 RepID=A0AA86ZWE3_9LACO|nr:hypothetical protein HMPREF0514_10604 [Lactobacillus paragasseri JV-V03]